MFFEFGIKDVIDIVLVALILYYIYPVSYTHLTLPTN